jgi:outer membrane protein assembly factor BamB
LKILLNKTKLTAIITIFLLMASASVTILPAICAKTTLPGYTPVEDRDTKTEVGITPDYLGVGQKAIIYIMTYPAPSGPTFYAQDMANALTGGLSDIEITITKPDGSSSTFKPVDETLKAVGIEIPGLAQIVGTLQYYYYPDQAGTYSVSASFSGKYYTTDSVHKDLKLSVYYRPSSTDTATTFEVVEEEVLAGQLNGWPWSPLPENYWDGPVQTDNREWAAISGDWTQGELPVQVYISRYNEYSTAPRSPHILWSNQVESGGLPGGVWGSLPYTTRPQGGSGDIILDGKIYQATGDSGQFECVDLRTGEQLWEVSGNPTVAHRLDPFFQTASQISEGAISVSLWEARGSSWKRYDPFDGDVLQTINNAPTNLDTVAFADGNPYVIMTQSPGGNIWEWGNPGFNNTRPMGIDYCNLIKWDMSKVSGNEWSTGIVWNVSVIDTDLDMFKGEVNIGDNGFYGVRAFPFPEANTIVVRTHNAMRIMAGFDYTTGAFLWRNNNTIMDIGVRAPDGGPSGPLILMDGASGSFVAYNVKTGREQWRASFGEMPWALTPCYTYCIHNGIFYTGSYDGHVYAYDLDDGSLVWQSDYYGDEDESMYGTQPFNGKAVGADGILYFSTDTVYQLMPRTRFHALVAIDEATGEFLWNLPIGATPSAIAEGYLLTRDAENGMQYCIGKGKTETSVSIQNDVIAKGSSALIKGSVMDLSPGQPSTPAVSEEDMSMWMDYLHGQNATLINAAPKPDGVSVSLTAVDSDGNWIDVGTTTSSMDGTYGFVWTPPEEGMYKIVASFLGSDSYWCSYDTTFLAVGPAASPTAPIEPEPTHPLISTELAIAIGVIAVAVIGAVAYVVYRKRK